MIELCAASLVYSDHGRPVHACWEIDLEVAPGEFLGVLGPSGSGKSSLLYLMAGLKAPSKGQVRYLGRDLGILGERERARIRRHEFGMVFQQPYLVGYLTALENLLLAKSGPGAEEALEGLDRLGLADKAHRFPHELSGGERQRVCVARALHGRPRAVFADEPTASLDHANGERVIAALSEGRGDGALVVVTHDPSMLEGADRVVRMSDGRIEA